MISILSPRADAMRQIYTSVNPSNLPHKMSALKMYEIFVRNPVTKETAKFLGQGETMQDGVKDGLATIGKPYKPKQDGKERELTTLGVKLPSGEWVNRSVKNFESETPYNPNEITT